MADPHEFDQPEFYLEPGFWYSGSDVGVFSHTNSGVGNRLAHSIADGANALSTNRDDAIAAVAKLFYEVQTNRLTSASDYRDLGDELVNAVVDAALGVIDLGDDISWDASAIQRVINAVLLVQID